MKPITLIIICISILAAIASAQTPQTLKNLLGDGIFVQGGLGYLALRDDYISDEKYSGSLPYLELGWLRSRDSSASRFSMEYRNSSDIRNNNVSASVTQTALNLDYLYPIGTFPLYMHDVFAFLGPSAETYLYFRSQNIANGGLAIFNAYSFATFFTLGINSELVLPMGSSFSAEWSGRLNLLGFGGRLVSLQDNSNDKFLKLVSIISGIQGSTNILLRYNVSDALLLKVGYRFEICQSTSWDYLLSGSDNVIFVVSYQL